jgi:WD40 repeat protein
LALLNCPVSAGEDLKRNALKATATVVIDAPMFDAKTSEALRLSGHAGTIFAVEFSPNGRFLASGDHHGLVKIWDLKTGKELHSFTEHKRPVRDLAFSSDSQHLVSTSDDCSLILWDVEKGELLKRIEVGRHNVHKLAFIGDSNRVLARDTMVQIRIWDLSTGESEPSKVVGTTSAEFSADGTKVVTATRPGEVKLWDVQSGELLHTYKENTIYFSSLSISPDERFVAAGSLMPRAGVQPVRVWDLETAEQTHVFEHNHAIVNALTISPDGRFVAATGPPASTVGSREFPAPQTSFTLWNLTTGTVEPIRFLEDNKAHFIRGSKGIAYACAFSPDSRYLTTAGTGGDVHVWKLPPARK